MNKIRILNIINIIIDILAIISDIVVGIIFKGNSLFYLITCLVMSGIGLINLVFIGVKEVSSINYDSLKFQPILWLCLVVLGVAGYYMIKYLEEYEKYGWLYWLSLILLVIIVTTIIGILDYKEKKRIANEALKRQPKFIVNKNRK